MGGTMVRRHAEFSRDQPDGSLVNFALSLPVALALVAFAIPYEARNAQAAAPQSALDRDE